MSRRSEPASLQEALFHLELLNQYLLRGSLDDSLILDGVCIRLASAIEALSRLPEERRENLFGDEWQQIWGTRNRIAHGYVWLNPGIIAETLEENVPTMMVILRRELGEERPL